jgi:hypothetical protein
LNYFNHNQKLGRPAVKTRAIPDSQNLQVLLPEKVLNYESIPVEVSAVETNTLPADTSFGKRSYSAPDGFRIDLNVVLMGGDRTSLHKPQYCLQGQGWCVDLPSTLKTSIHMAQPSAYDLPVVELVSSREVNINGENNHVRGIYVYYYVADGSLYAGTSGFGHMRRTAIDVLTTGTLPRWAYVSYFAWCRPGQEQATFERIKEFITEATPQFQTYPAGATALTARN